MHRVSYITNKKVSSTYTLPPRSLLLLVVVQAADQGSTRWLATSWPILSQTAICTHTENRYT